MNTFVLGVHKPQKNFIKENIKRVKGCNHCDRSKENQVSYLIYSIYFQ